MSLAPGKGSHSYALSHTPAQCHDPYLTGVIALFNLTGGAQQGNES